MASGLTTAKPCSMTLRTLSREKETVARGRKICYNYTPAQAVFMAARTIEYGGVLVSTGMSVAG